MSAQIAPLVPAECDLRGLPWMPIDTVRLLDSDLFALSTGEEFKAAVALWCKAWQQVPAASLPSDDRVLAHLSGAGARWKKVKEQALRGFVHCSDGRLYHPVIAEKALEAWEHREEFRESNNNKTERQRRWRERQKELSALLRERGVIPPAGASLNELERLLKSIVDAKASTGASTQASTGASTRDAIEMPLTVTGTGTGTEISKTSPPSGAKPLDPIKDEIWKTGRQLLEAEGIKSERAGSFLGKQIKDFGQLLVLQAVRDCEQVRPLKPSEWLVARCQERRTQSGNKSASIEARNMAVVDMALRGVGNG